MAELADAADLKSGTPAALECTESPGNSVNTGKAGDLDAEALARRLRREPDLAELVDVWPLLPEHVRQVIVTVVAAHR